jgi:hypothetical protein
MREFGPQKETREQVLEPGQKYRSHEGGSVPKENGLLPLESRHQLSKFPQAVRRVGVRRNVVLEIIYRPDGTSNGMVDFLWSRLV